MGQHYLIVNPDKRQYLDPHRFGCGLKLMEFSNSGCGPQQALVVLLAHANGRGGGDLRGHDPGGLVGSWAGDRVVVAGDYDDRGLFVPDGFDRTATLYRTARDRFEDISDAVIAVVASGEAACGHPWAALDRAEQCRAVPGWGVLPDHEPADPVAGRAAWQAYRAGAVDRVEDARRALEHALQGRGQSLGGWLRRELDADLNRATGDRLRAALAAVRDGPAGQLPVHIAMLADLLEEQEDPRAAVVRRKRTARAVLALFATGPGKA